MTPRMFLALMVTVTLAIGGALAEDSAGKLREAGQHLDVSEVGR